MKSLLSLLSAFHRGSLNENLPFEILAIMISSVLPPNGGWVGVEEKRHGYKRREPVMMEEKRL